MIKKVMDYIKKNSISKLFSVILSCAMYVKWLKKLPINTENILLESQHGSEISGNMFYLLKELAANEDYKSFKLHVSYNKSKSKKKIKKILDNYGIDNVTLVRLYSFKYMKLMASAKYLFNDNTFLPFFIKKEGQIYLNTWHGTPLKTLGKGIKNAMHGIGNTQKNFVFADYLLYPNKYTMEHMLEDYMLKNIASGKCVLGGYPRNAVFFDKERSAEVRKKAEPDTKKIYAYMPTWRGVIGDIDKNAEAQLKHYLDKLDKMLTDNEVLYVNLHPIAVKSLDFSGFSRIKKFPENYETYDFLNCTDCLITDYSSVFYDYAVTGKKCILFTYDEEEYFAERGVYKPLSELPFPKVKTVEDLMAEMRSPKQYDDTAFLKEYCTYDCADASNILLDYVIKGKTADKLEISEIPNNGKKNILLNAGNLDQNGVTTSIYNLLRNVDTTENNYYICFPSSCGKKHPDTLAALPEGVGYFPTHGRMNMGIIKTAIWYAFLALCLLKKNGIKADFIAKHFKDELRFEIRRHFGGAHFDNAIQFTGYVPKLNLMFAQFDCNTTIYVHNDMKKEIETRGNQRRDILEYAYANYDNVALVTEDLWESTSTFVKSTDNFKVVHNVIAYDEIIKRGDGEMIFEEGVTQSNKDLSEIKEILNSDAKKIISVGRYSPEKDPKRMIDAFNKVWQDNNSTYFIIIGGNQYNGLYDHLREYIKTLPCGENIILILTMANPMPIVKACDGFILGSHYEGFGLVIAEADILGLPVVSTDITGPRTFMQNNNGTLVENTAEGVEKGIRLLVEGKIPMLTTDYKKYNENAIKEFMTLIQ